MTPFFIRVPERLTEHGWLSDNGLNFRALLLWCHLFYNGSRNGDSWITFNELFRLVGADPSKRKKELRNDFIMAMERFRYDGLIDYKEDLSEIGMGDFVKVELKELFFKGKWKFIQLPLESYKVISETVGDVPGDVAVAVYVHVLKNLLSDGWCYLSKRRMDEELHVKNGTSSECLTALTKAGLLKKKTVKNKVTYRMQDLYAPKTKK